MCEESEKAEAEKTSSQTAAICGYIMRLLVKGEEFSLRVRFISSELISIGLTKEPDIWKPLRYLVERGLIELTDERITAYTAYERDGVVRLTSKGIVFIKNGGGSKTTIDL